MASQENSDEVRRTYWIEQLDAAERFMQAMETYPVRECGERMLSLREAAANEGVEMLFSTRPAPGGKERIFYLRERLMPSIMAAAREMNQRGWVLKIEDAYRTMDIQRGLALREDVFDVILSRVRWELKGRVPTVAEMMRRVAVLVATCPKVGTHMSGSALDISVMRRDGTEVDRGAPYLEMSELTPMDCPFISAEAQKNRKEITSLMARHGFAAYPWEFWHYSSGDAYFEHLTGSDGTARYGAVNLDLATGRVEAIPNPAAPLHAGKNIQARIEGALERLEKRGH